MYAILNILDDMRPVSLCFSDKESAESFLALVNVYEDDSGSGNGYSAYWPNYRERQVLMRTLPPLSSAKELDAETVKYMLLSIYRARAARFPEDAQTLFSIKRSRRAIIFSMNELPPRVRPTTGDMYRVPRSLSEDGMGDEGRVIEDAGDILKCISSHYWQPKGFRPDVEVVEIKASQCMKTYDWLRDLFPARTSWGFYPAAIRS